MSCGSLPAAIPAAEKARNNVVLVNFRICFQTAARSRPSEMMTGSFMKSFPQITTPTVAKQCEDRIPPHFQPA
jgi:hypothetical protein